LDVEKLILEIEAYKKTLIENINGDLKDLPEIDAILECWKGEKLACNFFLNILRREQIDKK
jgi:hypothetical protein